MQASLSEKDNNHMGEHVPKVSLIVPMFMCEDYVEDLLDNLCGQTFRDIEIICVVDGSPDRTYQLVGAYAKKDPRIRVFEREHKGAGAARNFGMSQARGEYLMFPDADDEYAPEYVSRLYEAVDKNHADIAVCHFTSVDCANDTRNKYRGYRCVFLPKNRPIHLTEKRNNIKYIAFLTHNKIYKRALIDKNELHFSETYGCNDVLFCETALLCADTIVFVNDHLLTYKYLSQSSSISASRGNHPEDVITVYYELYEWLKDRNLEKSYLPEYCKKFSNSFRYYAAHCCSEVYAEMMAREFAEEEPWKGMSDAELEANAMFCCGLAKRNLKRCKKALLSASLTPRQREILESQETLAEQEMRNYSEVARILREEYGRNVRLREGYLAMRMAQVRQVGIPCAVQIAYRKLLHRIL